MKSESAAFLFHATEADGIPPIESIASPAVGNCGNAPITDVGPERHSHIGIRELESHAASCAYLQSLATARYRGSKALADAQEAGRWLVLKEEAQKAVLALRREQFDADGADFGGEWTRQIA